MGKLGKLTVENIQKSIDSVTFLIDQINGVPEDLKMEEMEMVKQKAISLLVSLNKLALILKREVSTYSPLNKEEQALLSSLKTMNQLELEKEIARIEKEEKDVDIESFYRLRALVRS